MRLYVLDFGTLEMPQAGETRGFPGYLVETDAGRAIAADGLGAHMRPVALGPAQTVPGQLARVGLTVDDLDLLVLTHSDPDHIGGVAEVAHSVCRGPPPAA